VHIIKSGATRLPQSLTDPPTASGHFRYPASFAYENIALPSMLTSIATPTPVLIAFSNCLDQFGLVHSAPAGNIQLTGTVSKFAYAAFIQARVRIALSLSVLVWRSSFLPSLLVYRSRCKLLRALWALAAIFFTFLYVFVLSFVFIGPCVGHRRLLGTSLGNSYRGAVTVSGRDNHAVVVSIA
jgi:hypothetical protein